MVVEKKSATSGVKGKKSATAKQSAAKASSSRAAEATATINRRENGERRTPSDRRQHQMSVEVERRGMERRVKVSRRRQIDPTTCERDYSNDEVEFMSAMDDYKRRSGRMFPTCSEVLEVIRSLGYIKRTAAEQAMLPSLHLPIEVSASPMSAT